MRTHSEATRERVRPDALTGRLLDGRYRVGERIARGGMASVYQATDIRLDRLVAVKVMHPGLGDDSEFAERFVREARAAARLSHPNIVAIHDQGEDDGVVFLAMEYVPGSTLRDVIAAEAPLDPRRALALIEPIVAALATAHRAGLIHRDVKPENVLVSEDHAKIKVADFGLAKAVSAHTQHTVTGGVLIGTVSYLAPELVTEGRADARADVYALGVLLYELLTGQKPHEGETPIQVAYKHVHTDVPAPSALNAAVPAYVDALVARATSRDRSQRPADAGVLLHHVRRVAQALRDGVSDDPELTADLRPRPLPEYAEAPGPDDTAPFPMLSREHTSALDLPTPVLDPLPESLDDEPATAIEPVRRPVAQPTGRRPEPPRSVVVHPRRRSARGPLLLLLVLLVVAAAGGGAYWYGVARYTSTPGVLGLNAKQAGDRLHDAGLRVAQGDAAYSESVEAGRVITTDPKPGERVLDDGTVTLTVSLGKERYDVPKLQGEKVDAAEDSLTDTNLTVGSTEERWNETIPAGEVIRTVPAAGTSLKRDTAVDLYVSKGPKPIKIADWTGKDAAEATSALEAKGLNVDRLPDVFSDDVAVGDIVSQTPSSGTLTRGDTVQLTVSKGPEMIAVPDGLRGAGVDAAKEQLKALGFKVVVQNSSVYLGLGYVFSVDPGEGEMVPVGSTITLSLV